MVTATDLIERLERARPATARAAVASLVGLIDLTEEVRDDIAIVLARVRSDRSSA